MRRPKSCASRAFRYASGAPGSIIRRCRSSLHIIPDPPSPLPGTAITTPSVLVILPGATSARLSSVVTTAAVSLEGLPGPAELPAGAHPVVHEHREGNDFALRRDPVRDPDGSPVQVEAQLSQLR